MFFIYQAGHKAILVIISGMMDKKGVLVLVAH